MTADFIKALTYSPPLMRCYLFLCFLLLATAGPALARPTPLPPAGVLLGPGGWQFRPGPDSAAGPAWQALDPTRDLHAHPPPGGPARAGGATACWCPPGG